MHKPNGYESAVPMTVARADLKAGDLWWLFGGWHYVVSNRHEHFGSSHGETRIGTTVHAINARNGKMTYGTAEWSLGLRLDLAVQNTYPYACEILREVGYRHCDNQSPHSAHIHSGSEYGEEFTASCPGTTGPSFPL